MGLCAFGSECLYLSLDVDLLFALDSFISGMWNFDKWWFVLDLSCGGHMLGCVEEAE